jgi:hypothetical protein
MAGLPRTALRLIPSCGKSEVTPLANGTETNWPTPRSRLGFRFGISRLREHLAERRQFFHKPVTAFLDTADVIVWIFVTLNSIAKRKSSRAEELSLRNGAPSPFGNAQKRFRCLLLGGNRCCLSHLREFTGHRKDNLGARTGRNDHIAKGSLKGETFG